MELKLSSRTRAFIAMLLVGTLVLTPVVPGSANTAATTATSGESTQSPAAGQLLNPLKQLEPSYLDMLEKWKQEGANGDHTAKVTIPGTAVTGRSSNATAVEESYNGKNHVLVWKSNEDEWIEYEADIAQGGLYTIEMAYHPFVGTKNRKPIAINLTVDGVNSFQESKSIELYRHWKDRLPIKRDERGDEIRPVADDISGWMTWKLRDMTGSYEDPLTWYLKPGKHKIRLASSDPFALESITLQAPDKVESYEAVRKAQPAAAPVQAEPVVLEAEIVDWKSDSSVALGYDNNIASTPRVQGQITYNVIDGSRWSSNNQEISWTINVPETGYYKMAFRGEQSYVSNRSSFRQIMINGKVPFSELKAYRFMYESGMRGIPLADEKDEPYEFYLNKGANTLTMRVIQAPFTSVVNDLNDAITSMLKMYDDLKTLTGGIDDKNRTWDLKKDLPGFLEELKALSARIDEIRTRQEQINGRPDAVSQALVTVRRDIDVLLRDPDEIPYNSSRFIRLQERVNEQIKQLSSQPLALDRIYVVPAEQPYPKMVASTYETIEGAIVNFFYSFRAKGDRKSDPSVLDVWMLRGRDYVNMVQNLADETFTPKTGIKVRVNLLKDESQLVLMNAAGMAPDVAMGVPQDTQFDYAIRGGIYNLKQFPDFDEYAKQFSPGTWPAFYYDGGYYGVPETQEFRVLYYRKDILQRLGLKVPDTWEDLYKMLPILQQNGMNFTPVERNVFLQMHGFEYYTQDGSKTGLTAEKSFEAFKQWTDLQNKYAIDQQMDRFYQHFRDGSYPMGVADLSTYLQLSVAAPELNGLWGVAPIPGVRQEDGTVARWMGGNMLSSFILQNGQHKQESWEFLKWWTSADIQARYGTDLETLNGVTFRWFTSNVEAFAELPWKDDDLNAILEQWRWFREIPNVPGSYLMEREINNAWNRTVVDGMNYRTSLETSAKEMDGEIRRKLQEFKFLDKEGRMIRSMNLPVITKPWEGGDRYVKK
ncbi:extracellular solute-binding protein [Paenibacillus sp. y28]|uniref:extracellular solute-binding protein n=1 Tax=Paenibacillus sp. y28 TaxID=3129110 RepID=UPI003018C514